MSSDEAIPPLVPPALGTWRAPAHPDLAAPDAARLVARAVVRRGGEVTPLHPERTSVSGSHLRPPLGDLADLLTPTHGGRRRSVRDVMLATDTDGWIVARGRTVYAEHYRPGLGATSRHLLLSVSKSIVGVVVGILVGQGVVDVEALVAAYVPELRWGGYADARVRDVLDMRSGVAFREDYLDPRAGIAQLEQAVGWAPRSPGVPVGLRAFLASLPGDRPAGGPFCYRSCETDVLGWVCEAVTGLAFADLASRLLWARIGAQFDATISVDGQGTGVVDGGISATLPDLTRFGLMLAAGGAALGEQVVPRAWIADTLRGGPDSRAAFANSPDDTRMPGGMYRNQVWLPFPGHDVLVCLGIHGQLLYVNTRSGTVAAKVSSWPHAQDPRKLWDTLIACAAIDAHLTQLRPPA